MHHPLATALAERGNRVIVLDPLGHDESDRPKEMWHYSMPLFAEQVVALMDHLEIEEAVVGGTSLGANVTLETVVAAPDRVRGAVIEMPVLDNALLGCALAFTPMLVASHARRARRAPASRARPRSCPAGRSTSRTSGSTGLSQDPKPSASYLQGLFFGRIAPPRWERERIETKALVLGHPRDPIHPFSDAGHARATSCRNARMVEAGHILEMRLSPERLTGEIASFVDECWRPAPATAARTRRAASA